MKPVVINTNSWHFRFMNWCDHTVKYNCRDVCAYLRSLVFNMIMLSLAVLIFGGGALLVVGDTIAWIAACITMGMFIDAGPGPVALFVVLGISGVVAGVYHIQYKLNQLSEDEHNVVRLAYQSWKNNFCMNIAFDDVDTTK